MTKKQVAALIERVADAMEQESPAFSTFYREMKSRLLCELVDEVEEEQPEQNPEKYYAVVRESAGNAAEYAYFSCFEHHAPIITSDSRRAMVFQYRGMAADIAGQLGVGWKVMQLGELKAELQSAEEEEP